ncbi:hypothetical protein AB0H83_10060 [Dactylosporangium sp. NPDC050688]|uniref:hypothetical protein n=1 Tax=Dactylosporangium sp. NPDC050688 TaxID=3157217 RepID=UPI0033EED598
MVAGRWVLLILMVLAGPLLWLAGVAGTADAARALAGTDADTAYFIGNYDGPGRVMAGCFALLNLALLAALMPPARRLAAGRAGTAVRAAVAAAVAVGLAWAEHRLSPVTANWGGDPDAWSLVKAHVVPWYQAAGTVWAGLVAGAAATVTGLAVAGAVSAARQRAGSAAASSGRSKAPALANWGASSCRIGATRTSTG